MAATTEQKVDFLLKKVGYSLSKTGSVTGTGAISGGTTKEPFAETIASPIATRSTSIWADSTSIPTTPPGSDTGYVKVYAKSSPVRMTADSTVSGSRAFIAYTTYNNTSSAILGDWINTQFGADYIIEVYRNDPSSGSEGTDYFKLSASGASGDDTWFFDYASGVLNFNGPDLPASVSDTNIYIVGYRYIGTKGIQPPGGIGTFHNLYVSGLSTFVGVGTFNSHLYVGGNLEVAGTTSLFGGTITLGDAATDNVVFNADVDSNIIPDDNNTYDLGSSSQRWKKIYVNNVGIGTSTVISDDITTRHLKVTGIGTFDQRVLVSGITTLTGDVTAGANLSVTGITTLGGVGISTGLITGPANMYIDPATVGDNTGTLVIKGNLQVDGTQTTVNSTTMDVADKNVGIASGAANDAAADGAGITVYSGEGNKTFNWVDATDSWTSSENFDLASGKVFKINTASVLSNDTLGSGVVNSRLTSVDTLNHLKVAGITTLTGSIITGVTTITQLQVGTTGQTLVGITTILDEDDMASNSAAALATQQSIKAYVDAGDTAQDLDFFADSGGALSIDLDSESLELAGTTNEITTVGAGNSVTIGLPDNVIVGNGLTVTGKSTLTKEVGISSALTVAGVSTFSNDVLVDADLTANNLTVRDNGTGNPTVMIKTDDQNPRALVIKNDTYSSNTSVGYKFGQQNSGEVQFTNRGSSEFLKTVFNAYDGSSSVDILSFDKANNVIVHNALNVSGITTTVTFNVGTSGQSGLVGITTILDEDDMASDSATALATQQSIKKYVDDQVTAQDLDVTSDSGTIAIDLDSETLDIAGTANEIETSASGNEVTIGLPDDVTIADDLTVTGDIASVTNLNVTGVSTFTGNIDANGALDVDGTSDLDQVNIAAGLNVTAGISTFAELINATKSIQGNENLVVTGISTLTSNTYIGTAGTVFTALVGAAASVGIGSATPDYMLDVAGTINSETDVKIQGVSVTTQALNDAVAMAIALG